MADETAPPVLFEKLTPHIALVTLNRPEKRNAVNGALSAEMGRILAKTEADADIRAVILTSCDDKVFCAGADLSAIASGTGVGIETPNGGFASFCYAPRSKPWIAAVEGKAFGGGCEIVLACDMVVASEAAAFGLPEVARGLMAAGGGLQRIGQVLPRNVAREMTATGAPVDAAYMERWGVVNRLTAPGQAVAEATKLAEAIAANAPVAVQYSLDVLRQQQLQSDAVGRFVVAEKFAKLLKTEDYVEGPKAFVEKRAPVWKGR